MNPNFIADPLKKLFRALRGDFAPELPSLAPDEGSSVSGAGLAPFPAFETNTWAPVISAPRASTTGSTRTLTSTTTASTGLAATQDVGVLGGLRFHLMWDQSVLNLDATTRSNFESAVVAAATRYTKLFANNETINLHVGWGEVDGQSLGYGGALGESFTEEYSASYSSVRSALLADAAGGSAQQISADKTLGATSPMGSASFSVASALMKGWGYINPAGAADDGWIGLASTSELGSGYSWAWNESSIGANQYDAFGIAAHEISEVMGRYADVGTADISYKNYTPLDLFRYSSTGLRDLAPNNGSAYLSDNGGVDQLGAFNNVFGNGDLGDWVMTGDSYGVDMAGTASPLRARDVIADALIGYRLTATGLSILSGVA